MKAARLALARRAGWPYLRGMLDTVHQGSVHESAAPRRRPASGATFGVFVGSAIVFAAVLLGATALWAHYGTAIFFEMITSGIAGCF